ncbi:hypothetical protein Tco_0452948 [Tanacetum coccineum]
MVDWKSQVLQNFEVTKDMVDYVNEKYGTSWLFSNEVSDEILDDLLKRVYKNQQRVKDDKATETDIIDDVDKENVNVEVVVQALLVLEEGKVYHPKKVHALNLQKLNLGSLDEHGSVFRGKPGSTSKGVGVAEHSRAKQSKGKRKML